MYLLGVEPSCQLLVGYCAATTASLPMRFGTTLNLRYVTPTGRFELPRHFWHSCSKRDRYRILDMSAFGPVRALTSLLQTNCILDMNRYMYAASRIWTYVSFYGVTCSQGRAVTKFRSSQHVNECYQRPSITCGCHPFKWCWRNTKRPWYGRWRIRTADKKDVSLFS